MTEVKLASKIRVNRFWRMLLSVLLGTIAHNSAIANSGQIVARCFDPSGYGYFHEYGPPNMSNYGWKDDRITGGVTLVERLSDGKYDIKIIDTRNRIISLRGDGGEILLARKGIQDATFIYVHPGMAIEVYSFWRGIDGKNRFSLLSSKGGDEMLVHKSSVLVGTCSSINFSLLK